MSISPKSSWTLAVIPTVSVNSINSVAKPKRRYTWYGRRNWCGRNIGCIISATLATKADEISLAEPCARSNSNHSLSNDTPTGKFANQHRATGVGVRTGGSRLQIAGGRRNVAPCSREFGNVDVDATA